MKELSLNILDISENSVKAGATLIQISLDEEENKLTLTISDNGCGMKREILEGVVNPFYTTRTTRKVGLGVPLLKLAAEQTGGNVTIESRHESEYPETHGTCVVAVFYMDHIDFTPLGDVVSSIVTLVQGSPEIDFVFTHSMKKGVVSLDIRELREVLEGVPLNTVEVLHWISDNLKEQYDLL